MVCEGTNGPRMTKPSDMVTPPSPHTIPMIRRAWLLGRKGGGGGPPGPPPPPPSFPPASLLKSGVWRLAGAVHPGEHLQHHLPRHHGGGGRAHVPHPPHRLCVCIPRLPSGGTPSKETEAVLPSNSSSTHSFGRGWPGMGGEGVRPSPPFNPNPNPNPPFNIYKNIEDIKTITKTWGKNKSDGGSAFPKRCGLRSP